MIKTAFLLMLLVNLPSMLMSDGLSYADNQVFSHGYVKFSSTGPLLIADYPFAETGRKFAFQTSYRRLYGLRELTDNRAALAISMKPVSFGIAAALFGKPEYFHQLGLAGFAGYKLKSFSIGISGIYKDFSFGNSYDNISWIAINTGGSFSYQDWYIYAVGRSLNQPAYFSGGKRQPPEMEWGISYQSESGLDNQFKMLFNRHLKPTVEMAQSFGLTNYATISWSMVLRPYRFGAGLGLSRNHFELDYKFSHHPVLGWTHTISILAY